MSTRHATNLTNAHTHTFSGHVSKCNTGLNFAGEVQYVKTMKFYTLQKLVPSQYFSTCLGFYMYQLPALYAMPASTTADKLTEHIVKSCQCVQTFHASKTRDIYILKKYGDEGYCKHFYFQPVVFFPRKKLFTQ